MIFQVNFSHVYSICHGRTFDEIFVSKFDDMKMNIFGFFNCKKGSNRQVSKGSKNLVCNSKTA